MKGGGLKKHHVGLMGAAVIVGKKLELSRMDIAKLSELTLRMKFEIGRQEPGWISRYVMTHTEISKLIRRALEESHQ